MLGVSVLIGVVAGLIAVGLDSTVRTPEARIASVLLGMAGGVLGTLLFQELAGPVWTSSVDGAAGAALGAAVALVLRPMLAKDRMGLERPP